MLGNAVLSRHDSLASQSRFLGVEHAKLHTEEHGGPLTVKYLEYAWRDVLATYECYRELHQRFGQMRITKTEINKIFSEASLAKAVLRECGLETLSEVQPDFFQDSEILGKIMQTFCGGRVEAHIRKQLRQVIHCDMTSMYITAYTLMGFDRFLTASGITSRDATEEVQQFLNKIAREGLDALTDKAIYREMIGIVKIKPNHDKLPVRAKYNSATDNIALNYLTSSEPIWYALPHLVNSALHERQAPQVIEAIKFEPKVPQTGLQLITLPGGVTIDPYTDQIFKRVIELRQSLKKEVSNEPEGSPRAEQLQATQQMLKILALSGGYGIFVELNEQPSVRPRRKPATDDVAAADEIDADDEPVEPHWRNRICYSGDHAFVAAVNKDEKPGSFFHPLIGTLVTAMAQLLLGCAELLATRRDGSWANDPINWAYCDTDSISFARPPDMPEQVFQDRVMRILGWFDQFNPYDPKLVPHLLKIEDVNYKPGSNIEFEPLYIYAISSKRYALFNLAPDGRPIIRKASAHGLGYLTKPYEDDFEHPDLPPLPDFILAKKLPDDVEHHGELLVREIGVHRWQYDLWYLILDTIVLGHGDYRERLAKHPNFERPAMIQHTVRTTEIEDWFNTYNANKEYRRRVRPGNFISAWTPLDELPLEGHWQHSTTLAEDKQARRSYFAKLRALGVDKATRAKIEKMKPSDWHPVGPFTKNDPWSFKNAIDRVTGLPIPPWIEPRTYAMAVLHYHEMPEAKFLNGNSSGEMVCRHIIADQTPNYIDKATNHLGES